MSWSRATGAVPSAILEVGENSGQKTGERQTRGRGGEESGAEREAGVSQFCGRRGVDLRLCLIQSLSAGQVTWHLIYMWLECYASFLNIRVTNNLDTSLTTPTLQPSSNYFLFFFSHFLCLISFQIGGPFLPRALVSHHRIDINLPSTDGGSWPLNKTLQTDMNLVLVRFSRIYLMIFFPRLDDQNGCLQLLRRRSRSTLGGLALVVGVG